LKVRPPFAVSRRRFLTTTASAFAAQAVAGLATPSISRAADRPLVTHGLQSGDVSSDSAIVWARADRPCRMTVEASTTESFGAICTATVADVLPESDFTGKVLLEDLPAGQTVFYRVQLQNLSAPTIVGPPATGRFRTASLARRDLSFVWSGDVAGQGWGIDVARGGMRTFSTMRRTQPDFFIHSGDSIYADCIIPPELPLPNGEIWKNIVTEEKSHRAQTLADFRGNYKYNLLDDNVRAFNAEVPMFAQWDDHEVTDDWSPAKLNTRGGYDTTTLLLSARGRRAFHEFMPVRETQAEPGRIYRKLSYGPLLDVFMIDMRSYRGANGYLQYETFGPDCYLLGPKQIAWFKRELSNSRATWKVIAADLPLGLVTDDATAQGDGPPRGRELEIADLLSAMKRAGVANTVWLTADVHYTAAHHYHPNRAQFQDFDPFWEFVSEPAHAGTWSASELDNTFGPEVVFQRACPDAKSDNLAPCFGLQFFGHIAIDGATEAMTVTLKDVNDNALWSRLLEPKFPAHSALHTSL
jgi:alkaline phosphatase D